MKFLEPVFPAILPAVGKPEEEGGGKKKVLLGPEEPMIERLLESRATPGPDTAPTQPQPLPASQSTHTPALGAVLGTGSSGFLPLLQGP